MYDASTQGIMYIYIGNDEKIVYYILAVPLQSQKHHSTKNKVLNDESNNQTNKQLLHVYNILPNRKNKNFFFIKTQTPESALQRSVHKSYWEDPRVHNARSATPISQTIYSYAQASVLAC